MIVDWRRKNIVYRDCRALVEVDYDSIIEYDTKTANDVIDWYHIHNHNRLSYWPSGSTLTFYFSSEFDADRFVSRWLS